MHYSRCDREEDIMKTTGGFKLWQIIYPIGIYYVVSSLMYFVLGLFLGDGQQTYMLRQLICSAATIPATMSFYKQDKIAEQVVYGTEKEKLDTKWLTDAALAVVGAATLGIAVNNIIAMTPLVQMSEGFQEANQSFFAGTVVFELLGSCLVIPIAEELLFRGVVYKRLKLYFGVTPAGVQFLSDGKRHFVYGCDGSGRNSRCQPFLPEKIIRYIKTTFHYIFHKKSL